MVNALEAQNYRLYILRKMEKPKYTNEREIQSSLMCNHWYV